jgi:hypothetical protein
MRWQMIALAPLAGLVMLSTPALACQPVGQPHMVPASTKVELSLAKSSNFTLHVVITCPVFAATAKTPRNGLTARIAKPPRYAKPCPDAIAGLDHVTASGSWSLSLSSDGAAGSLTVPKAGATITFNVASGCVVTLSPSAETRITGPYNDVNTFTISDAKLPATGSGCTVNKPVSVSATIVLRPGVHVSG